jgi:hypothetical protein
MAIASAAAPKVKGVEVLGTVGYGTTNDAPPFGFMLGVDAGYTFRFGLRLGLDYTHCFGREVEQTRTGIGGAEYQVHNQYQSDLIGASIGYDWLIAPIRLRVSLDQGLLFVNNEKVSVTGYTYFLDPGFAAFWQFGSLEAGAGLKYYWLFGARSGVSGSLMAGARF